MLGPSREEKKKPTYYWICENNFQVCDFCRMSFLETKVGLLCRGQLHFRQYKMWLIYPMWSLLNTTVWINPTYQGSFSITHFSSCSGSLFICFLITFIRDVCKDLNYDPLLNGKWYSRSQGSYICAAKILMWIKWQYRDYRGYGETWRKNAIAMNAIT